MIVKFTFLSCYFLSNYSDFVPKGNSFFKLDTVIYTVIVQFQFLNYSRFADSVIYLCIYVFHLDQIASLLCVFCQRSFSEYYIRMNIAYLLGTCDRHHVLFLHSCNVHTYTCMYVTHAYVHKYRFTLTGHRYYIHVDILCVVAVDVVNRRI